MAVKFVYGSQSQYDHQVLHNKIIDGALYFINDTQRIYRGGELITRTPLKMVSDTLPDMLEPGTVYIVSAVDGKRTIKTIYVTDDKAKEAVKITDNSGDIDPDRAFEQLSKLTSEDVKSGVIENAKDDTFVTGGALREAISWRAISA